MRNPFSSGRPVGRPVGRGFTILLGLGGLGFGLALIYIGVTAADRIPGRSYYFIDAVFEDADHVSKTFQIREGAKLIGQVGEIRAHKGKGIVTLQIDAAEGPVPKDTTLEVRPRSPIGVRFVALNRGRSSEMIPEGGTIPITQTASTVPLDDALATFDPETRPEVQRTLRELGAGFAGTGGVNNQTLGISPEFLQDTDTVVGAINSLDGAVGRFIRSGQGAANAADPVRVAIGEGFRPEERSLRPFSQEDDALRAVLEEAPPTLRTIDVQLRRVDPLLLEVNRFSNASLPALRIAPAALREASAMLDESKPSLRDLDRTLALAERATGPALDVLDTVDPVLPDLRKTLNSTLPLVDELVDRRCDFRFFFRNWASMLGFEDELSGRLRLTALLDQSSLGGNPPGVFFPSNPYPAPCQVRQQVP